MAPCANAGVEPSLDRETVIESMERAATYFQTRLAHEGLYVWSYSDDGLVRRGEGGTVEANIGWVQPPGSPAIGAAYLRLFETSGNRVWLDAARDTAHALISIQLKSGGWHYFAETGESGNKNWCYARNVDQACVDVKDNKAKNRTVLDDNTTQSVIGFLIWFDQATNQSDEKIRKAINYSLNKLMETQYPNGSFPVYSDWKKGKDAVDPTLKATLPPNDWSRVWVKPGDPPYFVINDNIILDTIRVLLYADRAYGCKRCVQSAVRAGEFLLSAQLPGPQNGWAQTYDRNMLPVWGREFEPPAIASSETAGAIEALLLLHQHAPDQRYISAARSGIDWLRNSLLGESTWARFYELSSNRPLYINSKYELTYSDTDLLGHYNLKGAFEIPDRIERAESVLSGSAVKQIRYWRNASDTWSKEQLSSNANSLIKNQDAEGRWVENGDIRSSTFVDAIFSMSNFVDQFATD